MRDLAMCCQVADWLWKVCKSVLAEMHDPVCRGWTCLEAALTVTKDDISVLYVFAALDSNETFVAGNSLADYVSLLEADADTDISALRDYMRQDILLMLTAHKQRGQEVPDVECT